MFYTEAWQDEAVIVDRLLPVNNCCTGTVYYLWQMFSLHQFVRLISRKFQNRENFKTCRFVKFVFQCFMTFLHKISRSLFQLHVHSIHCSLRVGLYIDVYYKFSCNSWIAYVTWYIFTTLTMSHVRNGAVLLTCRMTAVRICTILANVNSTVVDG